MDACPEERLSGYLDGELPDTEARAIEAHLASCEPCAGELESLRRLEALTAGLTTPPVDDAEWSARWQGIAARAHRVSRGAAAARLWRVMRVALVPAAAAALIALAVGLWAVGPYNEAEADECVVEYVETASGYSSSYYHSEDAGVTIITLVPAGSEEASGGDASGEPD